MFQISLKRSLLRITHAFLLPAELSECASHCALCEAALNRQGLGLFWGVRVSFCCQGIVVDTMPWTVLDPVFITVAATAIFSKQS